MSFRLKIWGWSSTTWESSSHTGMWRWKNLLLNYCSIFDFFLVVCIFYFLFLAWYFCVDCLVANVSHASGTSAKCIVREQHQQGYDRILYNKLVRMSVIWDWQGLRVFLKMNFSMTLPYYGPWKGTDSYRVLVCNWIVVLRLISFNACQKVFNTPSVVRVELYSSWQIKIIILKISDL